MNDYAAHSAAMAALQTRFGTDCPSVSWGGKNYAIIPGSAQRRGDLALGGIQLNADLRFTALASTFGLGAVSLKDELLNTPVQYLGDNYKVDAVAILPGALMVQVDCTAKDQGS